MKLSGEAQRKEYSHQTPPHALTTIPTIDPTLPPRQLRKPNHKVQMHDSHPSREIQASLADSQKQMKHHHLTRWLLKLFQPNLRIQIGCCTGGKMAQIPTFTMTA
ncbi:hypothetical protein DPX16_15086 [Anabarilius grahami]|uniref:Uncharacterized protein n=1 Tax=Anabarilius grahami TaxID=495550 RepID=A0A3N0YXT4_ANAGA|nr:hypothetical protein DPX16_15086 [Anabarilius grahami]